MHWGEGDPHLYSLSHMMPALTVATESQSLAAEATTIVRKFAHLRDQALLLALLEYAPNEKAKANVAHKIIQCGDSYKSEGDSRCLSQVADFFWRNVILPGSVSAALTAAPNSLVAHCPVRVTGGKTPEPRSRLSQSGLSSAGDVRSPAETEAINDLKTVIETVCPSPRSPFVSRPTYRLPIGRRKRQP